MADVNGDLYATNVGLGTRVGVVLSEHAFGAGQRRDRGNLLLAVVIGWRTCHNNPCKAPIYRAACPGSPPEAGLLTARAHTPPDARAVTYIYRRAERVIHRFLVETTTKLGPHGDFRRVIHSTAAKASLRLRECFRL